MIFVTVGMHSAGFERLICEMDRIAAALDEPVIMQIGSTRYQPRHAEFFTFAAYDRMQQLCRESRLVVCQAATSIITALEQGAHVVAVPRQQRYHEHIDDHQVEFAEALSQLIGIHVIKDIALLQGCLRSEMTPISYQPGVHKQRLIGVVKSYVQALGQLQRGTR